MQKCLHISIKLKYSMKIQKAKDLSIKLKNYSRFAQATICQHNSHT